MPPSLEPHRWDCDFCSTQLSPKNIPDEKKGSVQVYTDLFFCYSCKAEFILFKGGKRTSISLYTKIGDRQFRWTRNGHKTVAQLWFIEQPGIPGIKKNEGLKIVKSFNVSDGDVIPDITLENVKEKLQTYLIFL